MPERRVVRLVVSRSSRCVCGPTRPGYLSCMTASTMTQLVLPELPYAYDALEPWCDSETLHLHHDKHHRAYVDKANAALEELRIVDPSDAARYAGLGEPRREFRDLTWPASGCTRLCWEDLSRRAGATRPAPTWLERLGRSPAVAEIAARLAADGGVHAVLEGLGANNAYAVDVRESEPCIGRHAQITVDDDADHVLDREMIWSPCSNPPTVRADDPVPALLRRTEPGADRRTRRHQPGARVGG
jgi:hypothetical protein